MIKSSANRDTQSIKSLSFAFVWRWEKKLQNWIDFSHFFTFFSIVWIRNGISQHNNAWKVDGISQHNNAWKFDCSLVWIFECIKYDNAKEDLFYWSKKKEKKRGEKSISIRRYSTVCIFYTLLVWRLKRSITRHRQTFNVRIDPIFA